MKKAIFKPSLSETFFRTTLNTVSERSSPRFGLTDAMEIGLLLTAIVLVMRYLITP